MSKPMARKERVMELQLQRVLASQLIERITNLRGNYRADSEMSKQLADVQARFAAARVELKLIDENEL